MSRIIFLLVVLLIGSMPERGARADLITSSYFTTGRAQIGIVNQHDSWTASTSGIHYSAEVIEAASYAATSSAFASLTNLSFYLEGDGYATHGFQQIPHNDAATSSSSFTQLDFLVDEDQMYLFEVDIASAETTSDLVFGGTSVQLFDVTNGETIVVFESDDGSAYTDEFYFDAVGGNQYRFYGTAGATIRNPNNTASGSYVARLTAIPEPGIATVLALLTPVWLLKRRRTEKREC